MAKGRGDSGMESGRSRTKRKQGGTNSSSSLPNRDIVQTHEGPCTSTACATLSDGIFEVARSCATVALANKAAPIEDVAYLSREYCSHPTKAEDLNI